MTPKKAQASDTESTVKGQLAQLITGKAKADKEINRLTMENEAFRKQNVQLAGIIENDLIANLRVQIQARSTYNDSDLESLTLEQLQTIDQTLSMGKGVDSSYKPIRVGKDSEHSGRLTVGSLYGLTKDQILAKGGEH